MEALLAAFGDRLYMELHRHGLAEEDELEPLLCEFARAKGVPLVAANRVLFRDAAFHEAHEALLAVAAGRRLHDEDRPRSSPAFRFLPPGEMAALFADLPEALANTLAIARRCAFYPRPAEARLPDFSSARESEDDRLKRLAEEGLAERLARLGEERGDGEGEMSKGDGEGEVSKGDGEGEVSKGDGEGEVSKGGGEGEVSKGGGEGEASKGDGEGEASKGGGKERETGKEKKDRSCL